MLNKTPMHHKQSGFTLIEVMIAVVIIGILASIAYPSYTQYVTRTYRDSAKACLSEYAHAMERRYAASLSYKLKDGPQTPVLSCATASSLGSRYTITVTDIAQDTFTVTAKPTPLQEAKETQCGTMTIDQKGKRTAATDKCW